MDIKNSAEMRIIDANINRVSEGLRVLDDIARFTLNDSSLSKSLKAIRHTISIDVATLGIRLVDARDVSTDWGATSKEKTTRQDLLSIVSLNSSRAQEGLRVIEELSKLHGLNKSLNAANFKRARFAIYDLERALISRLSRQQAAKGISGLYVIIDIAYIEGKDPVKLASQAIAGGASIIQLRHKFGEKKAIYETADKLQRICSVKNVLFFVNDHIDVALACNADGVHLGQSDLPLEAARKLMPIDKLIGCSASTVLEARKAQKDGADYIAVGAIFPTTSKDDIDVVGLQRLARIKQSVNIPVVAIGGINRDNVAKTINAGADSIAVISAVLSAPDVQKAASGLTSIIDKIKKTGSQ